MKTTILAVCAALAAFVAAENLNPPAITTGYWISTNATWCAAKTARVSQLAGEAFIVPVSNNVTFTWSASNVGVIVWTNSAVSFTNAVAYSTPIPQSGWNIDFAGDAVAGLWLKCSSGASNLVSITWFGRP